MSTIEQYANRTNSKLVFTSMIGYEAVTFAAFVTSFSQNFSSNWNTEVVYGRQDPIGTFQNTQRTISVGWDIPSGDVGIAKDNLMKVNNLIKMLYPAYSTGRAEAKGTTLGTNALSLAKSPLVKIKYANLINNSSAGGGLLGWISSINWDPVVDMGMYAESGNLYPKVISLSVEFNVLHENDLGKGSGGPPAKFPFGG